MISSYTIGHEPVPSWCAKQLTPFKDYDGTIKYEFHTSRCDYELDMGDTLIRKDRVVLPERIWQEKDRRKNGKKKRSVEKKYKPEDEG